MHIHSYGYTHSHTHKHKFAWTFSDLKDLKVILQQVTEACWILFPQGTLINTLNITAWCNIYASHIVLPLLHCVCEKCWLNVCRLTYNMFVCMCVCLFFNCFLGIFSLFDLMRCWKYSKYSIYALTANRQKHCRNGGWFFFALWISFWRLWNLAFCLGTE